MCLSQLETDHRLHRSAVRSVLQGREWVEQKEHPGQSSPLLPVFYSTIWTWVIVDCRFFCTVVLNCGGLSCPSFWISALSLRPVDVEFMKALHEKVNTIPLIAKADCLTPNEIKKLKDRVSPASFTSNSARCTVSLLLTSMRIACAFLVCVFRYGRK